MNITIFKQENYLQELGVGQGFTIARYGCALTCLASLARWYGRSITPDQLNLLLIQHQGFASNGTTYIASDGTQQPNLTLLKWGTVTQVYGEIQLKQNIAYPNTPADMEMVDAFLAHGQPIIVGVSFLHNAKDTVPSHYVLIYRKNSDGSYQCMDPWFGDDIVFDKRYAVNGMTVANAILQVVAYSGPAPQVTPAPEAAHTQVAVTPTDVANSQATSNYNLYLAEVDTNKGLNDRIQELQQQVTNLQSANTKLTTEVGTTKDELSNAYALLSATEKKDSTAIETAQKQIEALKEKELIANSAAEALQTKSTLTGVLSGIESLLSIKDWANKLSGKTPPKPQSILSALGIQEGVSK